MKENTSRWTRTGSESGCVACKVCDWHRHEAPDGSIYWVCPYGGPFTGFVDSDGNPLPDDVNLPPGW